MEGKLSASPTSPISLPPYAVASCSLRFASSPPQPRPLNPLFEDSKMASFLKNAFGGAKAPEPASPDSGQSPYLIEVSDNCAILRRARIGIEYHY
jgi:hypothetical protein